MTLDLLHGDCLDLLPRLPAQSVDMILCDLPYGTTQNKWDSVIPFDRMWAEYWRVTKPGAAVVLTAAQPFTSALVMSQVANYSHCWVWRKNNATGHLNARRQPMREHEDVLVFSKGPPPYHPQGLVPFGKMTRRGNNGGNFGVSGSENFQESTNYPRTVLGFATDGKLHPTQKPVALCDYLIRTYTQPGDVVLDNCMGSGSTGVAALAAGRGFIGMERDEGFFQTAAARILA